MADRFRTIFERSPEATLVVADGAVRDANDAARALFSGPSLLGRPLRDLFDDGGAIAEGLSSASGARTVRGVASFVRDGERRRVAYAFAIDAHAGEHVLVAHDVTERSRREEMWERYQLLSENAHDILLFIRRDGSILDANEAAAHAYGYTRDELRRLKIDELRAPPTREIVPQQMEEAFERGLIFETLHMRRDGTTFPVEVSSRSAKIGDEPVLLSIIRDLTERNAMQARLLQADRMAAVGTLAAGVAHEINNPLAYALTNLEVLGRTLERIKRRVDEPLVQRDLELAEQMLSIAREGADRVRAIVRDLKTFSRGDDGQRGPVDVRVVLDSCIKMAAAELRHRARLVRVYHDVPQVEASESRLAQVFLNLLVNSAQAFPPGDPERCEIRVRTSTSPEGGVVVEVEDNGPGIREDLRDRIFDPFVTTKPVGEGTGLGLFISREIVNGLRGRIEVDSDVGRGTTMRVTLPSVPPDAPPSTASSRRAQHEGGAGRLLVIDDEDSIGLSLRRALEGELRVVIATSGREAIDLLANDPSFDVVLCDVVMPDVDGIGVFREVSRTNPSLADRFLFMTGGVLDAEMRAFQASMAHRFLDKPFSLDELREMMRRRALR